MRTIADTAKLYCLQLTNCNLTRYDLEQAFVSGAKWMVNQHIDEKTLLKIKEKQKNDKIIVEVSL